MQLETGLRVSETGVEHWTLASARASSTRSLATNDGDGEAPETAENFLMSSANLRLRKALNTGALGFSGACIESD